MNRARDALAAAWWWSTLAAALVWWAPAIALMAARLLLDRVRFQVAMGLGRALVAVGLRGAAWRLYGAERRRAVRRMRALRERRGW